MQEEIWKDIPRYEGYQASNLGRIRTYNKITYTELHGERHWKNRILKFKPSTNSKQKSRQGMGYRVSLWKNGKHKDYLVARLVATTFLEDLIETDMTVNHKDGNRLNNNVENLEWLTRSENIRYGFDNGQYPQKKTILWNEKEKIEFRSESQAALYLNRNSQYISQRILRNKTKVSNKQGEIYNIKVI